SSPSAQFVNAEPGKPPRAGGSNYVAAYTLIHGDFPVLGIPPNPTSSDDAEVRDLMNRVEILGVWDRQPFAPRITMTMRNGTSVMGQYQGDELEWDLATELKNLRPAFDQIDWPNERLEGIVDAVCNLESAPDLKALLALCVP